MLPHWKASLARLRGTGAGAIGVGCVSYVRAALETEFALGLPENLDVESLGRCVHILKLMCLLQLHKLHVPCVAGSPQLRAVPLACLAESNLFCVVAGSLRTVALSQLPRLLRFLFVAPSISCSVSGSMLILQRCRR